MTIVRPTLIDIRRNFHSHETSPHVRMAYASTNKELRSLGIERGLLVIGPHQKCPQACGP
jgi:hypothetical protein